jgi:uncharacterized protein (TIGR02145 family)
MQGFNNMKKCVLLVCIAMGLVTCSNNHPTVTETATVVPTVLWKTSSADAIPAGVDSVRITISSTSLSSSMVKIFSYNDNQGTIPSVPAEISITITVEGIDSLGRVLYSGSVAVARVTAPSMDITIEASQVTPVAPSDLVAQTLSYNSIRLIWKENSTNETYYLVNRQASGAATWDSIGTTVQNTFTDSTLAPVTQYLYRVIAANAAGRSAATAAAAATTLIMDKTGPLITISSFKKIDTVNTFTVTLYGTAKDTSKIYQVMINDIVAQLSGDQWIKQNYYLSDTVNTIIIKATDNSTFRNVTLDTLTLIYKTSYIDTTNHAPLFTVTGDSMKTTVKAGQTYKKLLSGFDVDANDTFHFVVSTPLLLLGKDTVLWRPNTADIGSKSCYALVYDKKQAYDSIGWTIRVIDSATPILNHWPVFVTKASEIRDSMSQNKQYRDTLVASDEDVGQKLTFSILTGPPGLSIGDATGIITWTAADTGTFPVTARVTDDSLAYADIGWRIRIIPASVKVNNPPVFFTRTMDMTATATVGVLYKDTVIATDPDSGAVLRYSVVNGPVRIDSVTGIVTWSPPTKGNISPTVRVKDEAGGQADLSWPITVQAARDSVTVVDGNVYHTVTIGTQVWMVENLKTTKYNDGNPIPMETDPSVWPNLTTPAYCWYNDSAAYGTTYGALYNCYAVNTGKLAPTGWHVPTDSEWSVLTTYLGGETVAGGKMKESGMTHWLTPNTDATNETGFSALPGGSRSTGAYSSSGMVGDWWSSTSSGGQNSWFRSMSYNSAGVTRVARPWFYGFSVRCVKGDPAPQAPPAGMKLIPGGLFMMGSNDSLDSDAGDPESGVANPAHRVTVSSFYIDTTPVTQEDYSAVMKTNSGSSKNPVVEVTWYDAVLYCNARSQRDDLDTVYTYTTVFGTPGIHCTIYDISINLSKNGYRLPTEAQWEFACRAGSTSSYFWGEDTVYATTGQYAWYSVNSAGTTHPVATKKANAWGLYDMVGNAWQWCNDWYAAYSSDSVTNPTGPATGSYRVLRGGHGDYSAVSYMRSAFRFKKEPGIVNGQSFRCARPQ